MDAVSFLECCIGCSAVLLSMGALVKLARPSSKSLQGPIGVQPAPKWEPIPDPTANGLQGRLESFQSARFASPIVQRTLNSDAGPVRRDALFPPPPTTNMSKPRHMSRLVIPESPPNKVITLPLKQPKDDK